MIFWFSRLVNHNPSGHQAKHIMVQIMCARLQLTTQSHHCPRSRALLQTVPSPLRGPDWTGKEVQCTLRRATQGNLHQSEYNHDNIHKFNQLRLKISIFLTFQQDNPASKNYFWIRYIVPFLGIYLN